MKIKYYILIISILFSLPVYAKTSFENMLRQYSWSWENLGSHSLFGTDIMIFKVYDNSSPVDLAEKISKRFNDIFRQLQVINNTYILGGLFESRHVLAQVYQLKDNESTAYISILGNAINQGPSAHNILPINRYKLFSFSDSDHDIYGFSVDMPLQQVYLHINQKLKSDGYTIKDRYLGDTDFYYDLALAGTEELQIYAVVSVNKTVLTTVYRGRQ